MGLVNPQTKQSNYLQKIITKVYNLSTLRKTNFEKYKTFDYRISNRYFKMINEKILLLLFKINNLN